MPVECSKLTCFAKVKIRHGSRAARSTIRVGRCQSSFVYCEAGFDLGKGKNRSKATYTAILCWHTLHTSRVMKFDSFHHAAD